MTKSVMSLEFKIKYQSEWTNMLPVDRGFHWLHSIDAFSVVPHLFWSWDQTLCQDTRYSDIQITQ